jgi:hypothetical protein
MFTRLFRNGPTFSVPYPGAYHILSDVGCSSYTVIELQLEIVSIHPIIQSIQKTLVLSYRSLIALQPAKIFPPLQQGFHLAYDGGVVAGVFHSNASNCR